MEENVYRNSKDRQDTTQVEQIYKHKLKGTKCMTNTENRNIFPEKRDRKYKRN